LLDDAADPQELKIPGMFLHPLKGDRKGQWAMTVSGTWRITFAFDGEDVIVVNLEDYH
jgi:proteic killer suppression protein